jgi:methanogenic corrinoid protein MtbC1
MDIREKLVEMIANANREGARGLIEEWTAKHGCDNLMSEVVEPALRTAGQMWDRNDFSLSHSYVASKIAEDALELFIRSKSKTQPMSEIFPKGPVVLGNAEDDCHSLGRKIVSAYLRISGWHVHDLGIDVDAQTFVDKAEEVGARVIGVSAMIYCTAENIRRVRSEIDKRGLKNRIQLAVGGAVFRLRPELVKKVGGDGTVSDAVQASELFERLWNRAASNGK